MFRQKLKNILMQIDETISIYDLAKKMDLAVDPMLEKILDITNEFKQAYKNNTLKMLKGDASFLDEFFKTEIIDLGFLCQHKIKEIKESMKNKHNTFGHKMFFDQWMLHRGY